MRDMRRLNSSIKLDGGIGVALPVCWRGIWIGWPVLISGMLVLWVIADTLPANQPWHSPSATI